VQIGKAGEKTEWSGAEGIRWHGGTRQKKKGKKVVPNEEKKGKREKREKGKKRRSQSAR
jgi:hypothetical protein